MFVPECDDYVTVFDFIIKVRLPTYTTRHCYTLSWTYKIFIFIYLEPNNLLFANVISLSALHTASNLSFIAHSSTPCEIINFMYIVYMYL